MLTIILIQKMPVTRSQTRSVIAPVTPAPTPTSSRYITRSKIGIITEYDTGLDKRNRKPEPIAKDTPRMPNESLIDYVARRGKYPPYWKGYVNNLPFTNEFIEMLWDKYDSDQTHGFIRDYPLSGYRQDEEIYETLRKLADKNNKKEIRRLLKLPGVGWPVDFDNRHLLLVK